MVELFRGIEIRVMTIMSLSHYPIPIYGFESSLGLLGSTPVLFSWQLLRDLHWVGLPPVSRELRPGIE